MIDNISMRVNIMSVHIMLEHIMFVNRTQEIEILKNNCINGNFITIWGRRRLGKSTLLKEYLRDQKALYIQAIKGETVFQWEQILEDCSTFLPMHGIQIKSWDGFFSMLNNLKVQTICLDEFPYLVDSDSSVPSRFQRWIDHHKRDDLNLILCGSSQKMMLDSIIEGSAPLYGRAKVILRIEPMGYREFAQYCALNPKEYQTFLKYSLLGGVPLFWNMSTPKDDVLVFLDKLYFSGAAPLSREAERILHDEEISGLRSLSIVELLGRGVQKASELASRLAVPQSGLTRGLEQLKASTLVIKESPFGCSPRETRKTIYKISDPYLQFYYSVYSHHCTRWQSYKEEKQLQLVHNHASLIFEDFVRKELKGQRYWEKNLEIDGITVDKLIFEVKFRSVKLEEKKRLLSELESKYLKSKLTSQIKNPKFEIIDLSFLERI